MIRQYKLDDLSQINILLQELNYKISDFDIQSSFIKTIVYEQNNNILGLIIFRVLYDQTEIDYIVVNKSYRKKGIGKKLVNYIFDNYKDSSITLEVKCNNKDAIEFYKKLGFKIVATRKNYYNGEDGYLMFKDKVNL